MPLVVLSLLLAASPLADAIRQHGDLDYEGCVATLGAAKSLSAKERAQAELVLGLCQFALGKELAAKAAIESSFRRDPTARPPSSASPKELEFIESVRARTAAEPPRTATKRAKKEPEPVRPADAPVVSTPAVAESVVPAVPTAAPAAEAPPAPPPLVVIAPEPAATKATWLPWLTGGIAVASAGAGVGLGLNARSLETTARNEPLQLEAARVASQAQGNATAANVAFVVAGTAAVATVIVSFLTR